MIFIGSSSYIIFKQMNNYNIINMKNILLIFSLSFLSDISKSNTDIALI